MIPVIHPRVPTRRLQNHGDMVRAEGSSSANELISTSGHTGTYVDPLTYVSYRGNLHGGTPAHEAQQGGRFSVLGVDTIEPLVCQGVLLDVAGLRGVDVLPGGYGMTAEDLASAEREAGVQLRTGDVALIRSGWARHYGDAEVYLGHESGAPGPTEEAARWLAGRGVRATGDETIAYEQIKPEVGHALLPVHRLLLAEHGIHIIEVMNLSGLAAAGVQQFVFVLAPLKIVGGLAHTLRLGRTRRRHRRRTRRPRPDRTSDGRFGFRQAYLGDRADTEALTRGLGEQWELMKVFFKPYPANHFTHAGIDAAITLCEEGLDVGEIEEVELGVASPVLRTIVRPEEEKARPKTGYAAQFSGPFTVATALVGGGGLGDSLDDFTDDEVEDPVKVDLASRVRCFADEECDRIFPNQFPAVLRVHLKSGEVREARVSRNRSGPENPLSDEELEVKFRTNAGRVLAEQRVEELLSALQALEGSDGMGEVMRLARA